MIDKKSFAKIKSQIEKYDSLREEIILASREVLKNSKLVIYALHRDSITDANKNIKPLEDSLKKIKTASKKDELLKNEGSYSIAMQEYVEAMCFYNFITKEKIPNAEELDVDGEHYLLGLCDLTGELERKSVILATKRDIEGIKKIKQLIEDIFGEILKLNLRNSELRKKSDSIKWNLKKVEEVLFTTLMHS